VCAWVCVEEVKSAPIMNIVANMNTI